MTIRDSQIVLAHLHDHYTHYPPAPSALAVMKEALDAQSEDGHGHHQAVPAP